MRYFVAILFLCMAGIARADSRADLESPSQEVRDKAAKTLRETYQPPPRGQWDKLAESLKDGDPESKVTELFHPLEKNGGMFMNMCVHFWYRLDDAWLLECAYEAHPAGNPPILGLARWFVLANAKPIMVRPPKNYTGTWTIYCANGQPFRVEKFQNGKAVKTTYFDQNGKPLPSH